MYKSIIYRDVEICKLQSGYTVFYEGDEVYFETVDDAMLFIDEVIVK